MAHCLIRLVGGLLGERTGKAMTIFKNEWLSVLAGETERSGEVQGLE